MQIEVEEGAAGDDGEERTHLVIAAEVAAGAGASSAASSVNAASSSDRTRETDDNDNRDNSDNDDRDDGRHRPEGIELPTAVTVASTASAVERSPVPAPSAPPMEEDPNVSAFVFDQTPVEMERQNTTSSDLPEERLRELISETPRATAAGATSTSLNDDDDEAASDPPSRPISANFRLPRLPATTATGPPSAKGLSEGLTSPRKPNIRRSNEYVKIRPSSMEVITTMVPAEGEEEEAHYSSVDEAAVAAAVAAAPAPLAAAVDVHHEISFADDDDDDDVGIVAQSPRPAPNETAL